MSKVSFRIILSVALVLLLAGLFAARLHTISSQKSTLQPFRVLQNANSAAFSPDGTTLALGGTSIRLWNLTTFTEDHLLPFGGKVGAFSPDGHWLAVSGQPIRLWNLSAQHEVPVSLRGSPEFSLDGSLLNAFNCHPASSTLDEQFASYSWDVQFGGVIGETKCDAESTTSGNFTFNGTLGYGYFSVSPGKKLKAIGVDFPSVSLQILDASTNHLIATLPSYFGPLSFSSDGKQLAAADTPLSPAQAASASVTIHLFDVGTWQEIALLESPVPNATQAVWNQQLVFSPDNKFLAYASDAGSVSLYKLDSITSAQSIKSWATATPTPADPTQIRQITLDRLARYGTVAQSLDGKSAVMYNSVSMWLYQLDAPQTPPQILFQATQDFDGWPRLGQVSFTPDKSIVAAGTSPGSITIWDTRTGKSLHELRVVNHSGPVWALSPDGTLLVAVGTDGWDGHVWQTQTGVEIAVWQADQAESVEDHSKLGLLQKIAYSPDGKLIALGSFVPAYSQVRVLQIPSGKKLAVFTAGGMSDAALAFSPDGATVIYGANTWPIPEH